LRRPLVREGNPAGFVIFFGESLDIAQVDVYIFHVDRTAEASGQ